MTLALAPRFISVGGVRGVKAQQTLGLTTSPRLRWSYGQRSGRWGLYYRDQVGRGGGASSVHTE